MRIGHAELQRRLLAQLRQRVYLPSAAAASTSSGSTCLSWPLEKNTKVSDRMLAIEQHWRQSMAEPPPAPADAPSKYVLAMFPYPSGRLHLGHLRVYTISDVVARYYRLNGYQVLHPIGWDAFGLPAENAARERGVDPAEWTASNIDSMRAQLRETGVQFDWNVEINTCQPEYYKWTQYIFTRLHRAGLVRRGVEMVNWDPVDKTVVAEEQIVDGLSWRSGAVVERRAMSTWLIETPRYAKRLLDGLSAIGDDRWHEVAEIQAHWIGACDVHRFLLPIRKKDSKSPERTRLDLRLENPMQIAAARFILVTQSHSIGKQGEKRNQEEPYLADVEVLNGVTGEWMPVVVLPAKAEEDCTGMFLDARVGEAEGRDREVAAAAGLELKKQRALMPMTIQDVEEISKFGGYGGYVTSRRLVDWAVSRQRAWGTPIPMILNEEEEGDEAAKPLSVEQLPLRPEQRGQLVEGGRLETDTLDTFFDSSWYFLRFLDPSNPSQLADPAIINARMPVDVYVGGVEHAALHLYYARFMSLFLADDGLARWPVEKGPEPFRTLIPQGIVRGKTFVDRQSGAYVQPKHVDLTGPMPRIAASCEDSRFHAGDEVAVVFEKMSKSKHNGVEPQEVLAKDGIDFARLQLLDVAAPRAPINWGDADLSGLRRWIDRIAWAVNAYVEGRQGQAEGERKEAVSESQEEAFRENYNYFVRNVSMVLEVLHLHNTAIARLQGLSNALRKTDPKLLANSVQAERCIRAVVTMLQAFAPHVASEFFAALSSVPPLRPLPPGTLQQQPWPAVDPDANIDLILLVNGVNCGRVARPRPLLEGKEVAELQRIAEEETHADLLEWLLIHRKLKVEKAEQNEREGFFVSLALQTEPAIAEEEIRQKLDQLAIARTKQIKAAKKAIKKEKKGDGKS